MLDHQGKLPTKL